ncbi:MAG: PAS domain S-box protein, partial [Caldimonas sp.]
MAPDAARRKSSRRAFRLAAALATGGLLLLAAFVLLASTNNGARDLGMLMLAVAAGLVASTLTAYVLSRRLRDADLLAAQSRDALHLIADRYWEQDRNFRFTCITDPRGQTDPALLQMGIGKTPWEVIDIGMSEAQVDAHRADLEAHRPFYGMIMHRRDGTGRARVHSVSGTPRYTIDGVFDGYWGVARDVTDEIRAQRAFEASETRYRELFESSPSPIFLHRHGIVFDANPSAAHLFGFADANAMHGIRMADLHPPGESQQRALERIETLERLPVGEGVPVRDFAARTVEGRPISVQATGVRVDAAGGPATLTIMFDITARLGAEAALRRSEAMLSHLFATSPDCITLSE